LANEAKKNTAAQPAGVLVPAAAVRDHDGKKVVYIAFHDKAMMREVQVLSTRSNGLLIGGLNGGEAVITSAPQDLKDRATIKIKGQS
jgi:hypothetical protein